MDLTEDEKVIIEEALTDYLDWLSRARVEVAMIPEARKVFTRRITLANEIINKL